MRATTHGAADVRFSAMLPNPRASDLHLSVSIHFLRARNSVCSCGRRSFPWVSLLAGFYGLSRFASIFSEPKQQLLLLRDHPTSRRFPDLNLRGAWRPRRSMKVTKKNGADLNLRGAWRPRPSMKVTKKNAADGKKKEKQPRRHFLESDEEENVMDFLDDGADESDDDAPVEVSSKKPDIELVDVEAPEPTFYEQLEAEQEQKMANEAEKKKARNAKKRLRREEKKHKVVEKVDEGVFKLETGSATFNIVSMAKNVVPTRATVTNFREELLQERTRSGRQKVRLNLDHKRKWLRGQ
uniref:RRP15-like protein n=1 Tax=Steinernema glaseri TaxID=37863 RepID=A0A1I7ZNE5_9BILA